MIIHTFHFYADGFFISWKPVQLAYRILETDLIYDEFLDTLKLDCKKQKGWDAYCVEQEIFRIESIHIDHNRNIRVSLKRHKD